MTDQIMKAPCMACPYRKDVESGLWAPEEYQKLIDYDQPTGSQPFAPFACHAMIEKFCHGWAVCHSTRGHENELIALRLQNIGTDQIPKPTVPLFESGTAAAIHGLRDIIRPGEKAIKMMDRLIRRYGRLRKRPSR